MSSHPLKVGVIGLGKLGLLHAAVVNALDRSRWAAAADTSDVVIDGIRKHLPGVAAYSEYERMLDDGALDAVFIASPTHLHVPMALACAARRIPFFVEKPLGTSSVDVRPLMEALDRTPVTNMVGYMARQIDTFRHAKQVLALAPLGRLIHLRATMYVTQLFRKGQGWRYEKKSSGGGVLITQNSHLIDLLCWYFGPVAWASGHVKTWYSQGVDDFAHAWLAFQGGLSGFIDASWSLRHHRTPAMTIEVHGERGTLTVDDDEVRVFLDERQGTLAAGWTAWARPELYRPVEADVGGPQYTHQDAEFLAAVAGQGRVDCDARSARHVQEVIDAIYLSSAEGGRRVEVKTPGFISAETRK